MPRARDRGIILAASVLLALALCGFAYALLRVQARERGDLRARYRERAELAASAIEGVLTLAGSPAQRQLYTAEYGGAIDRGAFRVLGSDAPFTAILDDHLRVIVSHGRLPADYRQLAAPALVTGIAIAPVEEDSIPTAIAFTADSGKRIVLNAAPLANATELLSAELDKVVTTSTSRAAVVDANYTVLAGVHNRTAVGRRLRPASRELVSAHPDGPFRNRYYASASIAGVWRLFISTTQAQLYRVIGGWALYLPWLIFAAAAALVAIVLWLFQRAVSARAREHESSERFQAVINTGLGGFIAIDDKGVVLDWSPRAEELFGWTREYAVGRELASFFVPESQRAAHRTGLLSFATTGGGAIIGQRVRVRALTADGSAIPISLTVTSRLASDGWRANAFAYDATAEVAAERRIREQNRALASFASVASHDMRAPLRSIAGFSSLVLEREENLSQGGREFLERVGAAVKRLQELVEDLIVFAKLDATAPVTQVSLQEVFAEVRELLDADLGTGRLIADPLPTVRGTRTEMRQLLQNLVGNAMKFRRDDRQLLIRVRMVDGDLLVQDNGIGIEPQYREQVLEPFKRLHTRTEYEGSGMGLAIVARICDHHDWQLSVEDGIEGGTTIRVAGVNGTGDKDEGERSG